MKRIYLAGPMTGIADLNFPLFNAEAARLRDLGYDVVNPAELNGGADELIATATMNAAQLREHWRACMRRDIPALLTCDGVALLLGWGNSKGARLECHIARQFDMPLKLACDLTVPLSDFSDTDWAAA